MPGDQKHFIKEKYSLRKEGNVLLGEISPAGSIVEFQTASKVQTLSSVLLRGAFGATNRHCQRATIINSKPSGLSENERRHAGLLFRVPPQREFPKRLVKFPLPASSADADARRNTLGGACVRFGRCLIEFSISLRAPRISRWETYRRVPRPFTVTRFLPSSK